MSDTGEHHVISEEFAVLDRAGRLQLPKAMVAALGLKDRVRLRLEDDHVEIWPDTGSLVRSTPAPMQASVVAPAAPAPIAAPDPGHAPDFRPDHPQESRR